MEDSIDAIVDQLRVQESELMKTLEENPSQVDDIESKLVKVNNALLALTGIPMTVYEEFYQPPHGKSTGWGSIDET